MTRKLKLILSNGVLRVGLVIFSLGILAVAAALLTGHFLISKIVQARYQIIDLSDASTGKRYRKLSDDYNSTKKERIMLSQVRPSTQEIAYLIQTLDGLAMKTQVKQTVELAQNAAVTDDLKYAVPVVRYKLNVSGNMSSVLNYVNEINQSAYLIRFVSLEISSSEEKNMRDSSVAALLVDVPINK